MKTEALSTRGRFVAGEKMVQFFSSLLGVTDRNYSSTIA